jgi:hypothetical protein
MPAVIRIAVSDPDLRAYVADCLHSLLDVAVVVDSSGHADLAVTDGTVECPAGEAILYLADEPGTITDDVLLMPFDSLSLRVAVLRALQRDR